MPYISEGEVEIGGKENLQHMGCLQDLPSRLSIHANHPPSIMMC